MYMKKILTYTAIAVIAMATVLTSCKKDVRVSGVMLNKVEGALTVGMTDTLVATVSPGDAENKMVVWTSSDDNLATVTQDGIVTAIADGRVTITVKTVDGNFE